MSARRGERGNVAILTVAAIALAGVLCVGVARVGGAAVLQARADTAADAAALAAAGALALEPGPRAAAAAAARAAARNGARLVSCECAGGSAEVVVMIGRAHGTARATVDVSRVPVLSP